MDQIKIGKFIAECRKNVNLTQMQLAELLNITDRAVSKWENGKAMPDSSIMLELCNILKITVNDLLSGEKITVNDYNSTMEERLFELIKEKESSDRRLLAFEFVIGALSVLILFIPILIAYFVPMSERLQLVICSSGAIPAFIGFMFCIKIEQIAGYYACGKCQYKYVPTFKSVNFSTHMGRSRYLKCPKCNKRSWHKKVVSKDDCNE